MPAMEKKAAKMLYLQSQQQEIVTLNVGGTLFQSTKTTLQADPSSILACILSNCKHRPSGKNYDFFPRQEPKALWLHSRLSSKQLQNYSFRISTGRFHS